MGLCSDDITFRHDRSFAKVAAQEPSLLDGYALPGRGASFAAGYAPEDDGRYPWRAAVDD